MHGTESDTQPNAAEKHHPMLKLALELGPLMVFFFANLRGAWLAAQACRHCQLRRRGRPDAKGLQSSGALGPAGLGHRLRGGVGCRAYGRSPLRHDAVRLHDRAE